MNIFLQIQLFECLSCLLQLPKGSCPLNGWRPSLSTLGGLLPLVMCGCLVSVHWSDSMKDLGQQLLNCQSLKIVLGESIQLNLRSEKIATPDLFMKLINNIVSFS